MTVQIAYCTNPEVLCMSKSMPPPPSPSPAQPLPSVLQENHEVCDSPVRPGSRRVNEQSRTASFAYVFSLLLQLSFILTIQFSFFSVSMEWGNAKKAQASFTKTPSLASVPEICALNSK